MSKTCLSYPSSSPAISEIDPETPKSAETQWSVVRCQAQGRVMEGMEMVNSQEGE